MAEKYSKLTLIWGISTMFLYVTGFVALAYSAKAIEAGGKDNKKRKVGKAIALTFLIGAPLGLFMNFMDFMSSCQIPG